MKKKLLCILAHPDDESLGPGGTLAKYAREGVEIHLVTASRGEAGQWHGKLKIKNEKLKVAEIRVEELYAAAKTLGIKKVEFLDIPDGTICNKIYHETAEKIMQKIRDFVPQVVITHDRLGVSGHLDHIGLSMITTYAFLKTRIARKLYYHCLSKKETSLLGRFFSNYFVYFPQGYETNVITTTIDTQSVWDEQKKAMRQHETQKKDVRNVILWRTLFPKREYFILGQTYKYKPELPETDLFAGIE